MKVLIAESDPDARSWLHAIVTELGHEAELVADPVAAYQALDGPDAPQIVILDVSIPGIVEVYRSILQRQHAGPAYILFTSLKTFTHEGITTRDNSIEHQSRVITDYLSIPYRREDLLNHFRIWRQIMYQNENMATDPVTGVLTRRAIADRLEQEINRAGRENRPIALIMIDLDNFKQINDFFGHPVGDRILQESAYRMKSVIRRTDIIGRWGTGDEFLIILPGSERQPTHLVAEEVCRDLRRAIIIPDGRSVFVTVSGGVLIAEPRMTLSRESLIRLVDQALYAAKHAGKNTFREVYC